MKSVISGTVRSNSLFKNKVVCFDLSPDCSGASNPSRKQSPTLAQMNRHKIRVGAFSSSFPQHHKRKKINLDMKNRTRKNQKIDKNESNLSKLFNLMPGFSYKDFDEIRNFEDTTMFTKKDK